MENLWPSFNEEQIEINEAVKILREQARYIQNDTKSKIRATFSKVSYKKSGPLYAVEQVGQVMLTMPPAYEEVLEEELQGKENVNNLFATTKYKFELFNDEYRFRLFVLNNRELFPVTLEVDGGILEDISYQNKGEIGSNDDLKSILREIFSSPKVRRVVSRMLAK